MKNFIIILAFTFSCIWSYGQNYLTAYDYWFDFDYSSKTTGVIATTESFHLMEQIDVSSLIPGLHTFHVRFQQTDGLWGSVLTRFFVVQTEGLSTVDNNIEAYEFWFDDAYALKEFTIINPAEQFQLLDNVDLSSFIAGLHTFHVRFQQTDGLWSSVFTRFFVVPYEVQPLIENKILAYRYWFDEDATKIVNESLTIPLNPLNLMINLNLDTLQVGEHYLNTQYQDEQGLWSSVLTKAFYRHPENSLDFTVYLEGPFNGNEMTTELNPNNIPLSQPYNSSPFNYQGDESVASIPNGDIVDWVIIELHDTTDASVVSESSKISQKAAFINKTGSIVELDGTNNLRFFHTVDDNLFTIIKHRNHLGILNNYPFIESKGNYIYDFSSGSDQVLGGTLGYKQIVPGIWGMVSGDGDANGKIELNDKTSIWNNQAGISGYLSSDYNLDGQSDNSDKNENLLPNIDLESQVPE